MLALSANEQVSSFSAKSAEEKVTDKNSTRSISSRTTATASDAEERGSRPDSADDAEDDLDEKPVSKANSQSQQDTEKPVQRAPRMSMINFLGPPEPDKQAPAAPMIAMPKVKAPAAKRAVRPSMAAATQAAGAAIGGGSGFNSSFNSSRPPDGKAAGPCLDALPAQDAEGSAPRMDSAMGGTLARGGGVFIGLPATGSAPAATHKAKMATPRDAAKFGSGSKRSERSRKRTSTSDRAELAKVSEQINRSDGPSSFGDCGGAVSLELEDAAFTRRASDGKDRGCARGLTSRPEAAPTETEQQSSEKKEKEADSKDTESVPDDAPGVTSPLVAAGTELLSPREPQPREAPQRRNYFSRRSVALQAKSEKQEAPPPPPKKQPDYMALLEDKEEEQGRGPSMPPPTSRPRGSIFNKLKTSELAEMDLRV